MKKIAPIFIAGFLGSVFTVAILAILNHQNKSETLSGIEAQSAPAKMVKHLPPEAGINFVAAAENSVHAVVHIKTSATRQMYGYSLFDYFNPNYNKSQQTEIDLASGSGVIISDDGYIVTNNHVIDKAETITITLNNKKQFNAEIIGKDPATDLALLKIDASDLPFIPYGNSDQIQVGEWVLAVGNPFNLTSTVTAGIVSAKARSINIIPDRFALESFIQTDAAVNQGNSGGALVNTAGQLIGINSAIASNTGAYAGYSFAIPVNIVKKIVKDLLEYGNVQRAYIGVTIQDLNAELAKYLNIDEVQGVYINGVVQGGAAHDAGLKKGDIIKAINDIAIHNVPELQEQIGKYRPNDKITVTIKRNGKQKTIKLTLRNQQGNTKMVTKPNSEVFSALGASFVLPDNSELNKLGINHGVKIESMHGGKLRAAGIKEGFIITHINHKAIQSPEALVKIFHNHENQGGILIEGIYPNGVKSYYAFGL